MIGQHTAARISASAGASSFAFYLGLLTVFVLSLAWLLRRRKVINLLLFNLGFLTAAIFAVELGYGWYQKWKPQKNESQATGSYWDGGYFSPDPVRGYGMAKNISVTSKLLVKDQVVYDAIYSSDAYGLRKTPGDAQAALKNLLFFGCSFTFGEGLSDAETLPAQTTQISGLGNRNFAFHGYGPHQFLAVMEAAQERELSHFAPHQKVVGGVFQTIPGHVKRSLGFSEWEESGPFYELDAQDQIQKKDFWDSKSWSRKLKRHALLSTSPLIRAVAAAWDGFWLRLHWTKGERLSVETIKRAQQIFRDRYSASFLVIVWPDGPAEGNSTRFQNYARQLREAGLETKRIDEIVPDYFENLSVYHLRVDGHPAPSINKKVAAYVAKYFSQSSSK